MFRDDDLETIQVSTSHVKLRLVCFILALVLALGAIGFGMSRLIHKDPGYYEIKPDGSEEAPQYGTGITLLYYLEGKSNSIGTQLNQLKSVYGAALLRAYKLLDSGTMYEGYANIATLNASIGQYVQVCEELYWVLKDAFERTQERKGYNVFAGALFGEWNSILSLDNASEFDPENNESMARRIGRLAEETAKLENFDLRFEESDYSVELWVSPEYMDFLENNGYSVSVLDLNLLSEAYRLAMVRDALEEKGCGKGYIFTGDGLTLSLSAHEGGEYCVYGPDGDSVKAVAKMPAKPNSAYSLLRSFKLSDGEVMYYTIEKDGRTLHRHPCFVTATGEFAELLAASGTVRYDGDIVGARYSSIVLYNMGSREEIFAAAEAMDATVICVFWGGETREFE